MSLSEDIPSAHWWSGRGIVQPQGHRIPGSAHRDNRGKHTAYLLALQLMVFTISCIGTSKDHSTHAQGRRKGFIDEEHSLLGYSTLHSTGTGATVHGRSHHWELKCVPLTDNHHGYSWDEFPISEGLERVVGYLGNTQHMHHNLACHTPFNCMHVPDYLITICTGSPGEEELQGPAEHVHVKHR